MIAPPMPMIPEEAHGQPIIMSLFAYSGPVDRGEEVLAPFRALADSYADMLRPMPYPGLYEGPEPEARFGAGTNFFADSFGASEAEAALDGLAKSTAMMKVVQLRVLGGAYGQVPNDATAFPHRDRKLMINVTAMFVDPSEAETHEAWGADLGKALGQDGVGYVGFLGDEDAETLRDAYPNGAWDRLRELKGRYDPDNLFHLNHNIPPA
jgi:FAD/FMN-containing dehydrogenase